ncbi:O-antigen ligase family protein [Pedobacter sp. MC2016-24]|uniref:O-antigen ligase family protein n=1 Tax=Pedobacter sp. MC2016-24 TaxID=2780090 RepID=UPI00187EC868|nr:O-antigen ligase family protein [Pedobacter sp. MC2016-24]MBE9601657.1 O-antigen ligase family protein [Pedobacter sp. MC2016-24]
MKIIVICLMILYLSTLSYGIFMTGTFRIPAPLLFVCPLIFFFKTRYDGPFMYTRELILLSVAIFLYYVVGLSDFSGFAANLMVIVFCAGFFNFFVGKSPMRFKLSILIFFILLSFSGLVMVFNHFYVAETNEIREFILGDKVIQTPAGISLTQFGFGYHLAALCPFAFVYTCVFKKALLIRLLVLIVCLIFLFLGMQRSVFVAFVVTAFVFVILYYRLKSIVVMLLLVGTGLLFYNFLLKEHLDVVDNIMTKNDHNDAQYNRAGLAEENLRIYMDYPYGLIFYGKNWGDVIYRDYVFSSGITSHNAYLMFFTYLGPFLGLSLLGAIYYKVSLIFANIVCFIRRPENGMLVCLSFAFMGISINALSHNPWLISADGPTVFLYFSMLHLYKMQSDVVLESTIEILPSYA